MTRAEADQGPPVQGIYENCDPATHEAECLDRLAELHDAGITVVLNYWLWQGTPDQVLRYAARAEALGMQIIWPVLPEAEPERQYPQLADACGCSGRAMVDYAVALVRDLPATWGYYVGEEAFTPEAARAVHRYSRQVGQLDSDHPRLYVGWGMYAGGVDSIVQMLRPFARDAEVIAADYYPVGTGARIAGVADASRAVSRLGHANGTQSATVLQAFNWASEPTLAPPGDHRWPTVGEMTRMRNLSYLAGDSGLMLWFDYYFLKPLGSSGSGRLDNLASALAAPYPVKVARLAASAGELRWQQSRPSPVILSVRHDGRTTRRRLAGHRGRFSLGRLHAPRGRVRASIHTVARPSARSTTGWIRLRVSRAGKVRAA